MAAASTPRKAKVKVTYTPKGKTPKHTSPVMAEYESGFSFTESATGQSDSLSLKLINRDLRWANKWMPKKGDKMVAVIRALNWDKAGQEKDTVCGKFCVDDLSLSGPELTCEIGALSVPESQAFRVTERKKTWKNVTIQEIAQKICSRYHLSLNYDAGTIRIKNLEQNGKTDSDFLRGLCDDYGLYIKVFYGRVFIYDVAKYEAKPAAATYSINDFQSWSFNTTMVGTYTGATIAYTKGKSDSGESKEIKITVGGGKRKLSINEKVDNEADARRRACAKVNEENRKAATMSVTIKANPWICSACCIQIKDAYRLNGKYFIDKVTHNVDADGAYTMDLELHRVQKKITG